MNTTPAKYITVIDYYKGNVNTYPIELWDMENKDIIELLLELGHISANCKWIIHKDKPKTHENCYTQLQT